MAVDADDVLLLRAEWIVPVGRPPIRDGRVAVRSGRVVWVGAAGEAGEPKGRLRDLGHGVLLPGLVNAHAHLELSHLHGAVEADGGFVPWVRSLVGRRGQDPEDTVRAAAGREIDALVERGTAAVGDVSNGLAHLDLLAGSKLDAVVFYELLAWDPERAESVLAAAESRVAGLHSSLRPGLEVRLAAHAPHSVSAALFERLRRAGGPAALHLAESPAESRFLATGNGDWAEFLRERGLGHVAFTPPRARPVPYVDGLGALHEHLVAAHCVYVDDADLLTLARRGVHVAVCPRSNRRLGVGIPRVPAMLAGGVRVCLGTDSLASVDDLDLLQDAAALHRQFPALAPEAIVRMATAAGAEALGLGELGTIAPGKRAVFAWAEADPGLAEPLAFLVSGEARTRGVRP
jgi:cytosine/adenosine deaminase-related metal-dependent hydrolase